MSCVPPELVDASHDQDDLRHFHASELIAAGCDVVTVQRALGHASATRTRTAVTGMLVEVFGRADEPLTNDAAA